MKTCCAVIAAFTLSCLITGYSHALTEGGGDITDDQVSRSELKPEVRKSFGKGRRKNPVHARRRGMAPTGLRPLFDEGVICRNIDEHWAIDYTRKRGREAYHGGIDIPAPEGTPILAVADGVVAAKFMNEENPKGIEIMLRHSPQDTGLSIWVYTQYTHLIEMPDLRIGQKIGMGEVIGRTGNTGISGREARRRHGKSRRGRRGMRSGLEFRRPALHFGVIYSASRLYMKNEKMLVPVDAYWMDPNALYRKSPPFDSASLKALPESDKKVPIPYILPDGKVVPADTRVIWPYSCIPE